MRRKPVPREWREDHHEFIPGRTRIAGGGWGGWSRTYRYGASCSCGEKFGDEAGQHTMNRPEVMERYNDHVEHAYYNQED